MENIELTAEQRSALKTLTEAATQVLSNVIGAMNRDDATCLNRDIERGAIVGMTVAVDVDLLALTPTVAVDITHAGGTRVRLYAHAANSVASH